MTRRDTWLLNTAVLLVGGTGLIYGVMRYLLKPVGEFAVVNHPWQPLVQHLHILFAPALVFMLGHVWVHHGLAHWRHKVLSGRRTGLKLIWTSMPMILSGYLLQISVTPTWRTVWIVTHAGTSTLWLIGFVLHVATRVLERRRT